MMEYTKKPEDMSLDELIRTIEDPCSTQELIGVCARKVYEKGKADGVKECQECQLQEFLQERALFSRMVPTPCRF
jgi:hypothetical protein